MMPFWWPKQFSHLFLSRIWHCWLHFFETWNSMDSVISWTLVFLLLHCPLFISFPGFSFSLRLDQKSLLCPYYILFLYILIPVASKCYICSGNCQIYISSSALLSELWTYISTYLLHISSQRHLLINMSQRVKRHRHVSLLVSMRQIALSLYAPSINTIGTI